MAHVHNFQTYFYVEIIDDEVLPIQDSDLETFKEQLNNLIAPGTSLGVSKIELL